LPGKCGHWTDPGLIHETHPGFGLAPLLLGSIASVLVTALVKPELVFAFRVGLGMLLFLSGRAGFRWQFSWQNGRIAGDTRAPSGRPRRTAAVSSAAWTTS
jgi:hypothetical protein